MATSRHAAVCIEGTWGTPETAFTKFLELESEDLRLTRQHERMALIRSPLFQNVKRLTETVTGTITVKANYQELDALLYLICGTGYSVAGAGPYTHTYAFTDTTSRDKGATFEISRGTTARTVRYAGCVATSWTHAQPEDGALGMVTLGLLGKSAATNTQEGTVAYFDNDLIRGAHGTTMTMAGNAMKVLSSEISIDWPLDERIAHGSYTFSEIPATSGNLVAIINATVVNDDDQDWEDTWTDMYATAETEFAVTMTYTDGTHSLSYSFPTCRLENDPSPELSGFNRMTSELTMLAYGDLTITLINDQALYTA